MEGSNVNGQVCRSIVNIKGTSDVLAVGYCYKGVHPSVNDADDDDLDDCWTFLKARSKGNAFLAFRLL